MKISSVKEFLSNKRNLFFLFGTFLFMMNISISYTVVPVFLISRGFNLAQVGISTTVYSLAAIVLRVFLGPLADKKGRKFALLISSFSFVISWLMVWLAPSFSFHLVARVFQAVGLAMYMSTGNSVVSDLVEVKVLGSCIGVYRGFISMGIILGPVFALTLSDFSYDLMFICTMGISFVSFLLLCFMAETLTKEAAAIKRNIKDDYLKLLSKPRLTRYYLSILVATWGYGIVNTNVAIILNGLDGVISASTFLFLYGVMGMIASMNGGRLTDRYGIKKVIIPGAFLALSGFLAMAFVESSGNLALGVVIFLMGLGTNSVVISSLTGIDKETPKEMKATSYAIEECAYDGGFAVGNLIFGILVTIFGYSNSFFLTGVLLAIFYTALFTIDYRRKVAEKA